jgi:hypothetical protein
MKIKDFSSYILENSDLDWSDKNWDERGQDGENPPNNGLEGSSAYQADYFAGNYGESDEEDEIFIDDSKKETSSIEIKELQAHINDLTQRIERLESKIK